MDSLNSYRFEMSDRILYFNRENATLLCKTDDDSKNLWIKKIDEIYHINDIIEDEDNYYLSCERDDTSGYYLAVSKGNGSTRWFIPGKAFFQILYEGFLYLIFIDEDGLFFLLKVERKDGSKVWFHKIEEDLSEYSFRNDRIKLIYISGKIELISPKTGLVKR